jgi:hypothetical protein
MKQGHALLVGIKATGKYSLTKMAAFAYKYTIFTIEITEDYS